MIRGRATVSTEEYLNKVTIGGATVHNGQISLCEYDKSWPAGFGREEEKIRGALGPRALAVEHVGSTSVPGLCAKPILDILLLVENAAREEDYAGLLERAGYIFRIREPDWYGHRMFKGTNPPVNLHVFSLGCEEAERMLAFRDWLRSHPADRDLYARTKRELAQKTWKYVQDYADAKTKVVAEIIARMNARKA
ncbi:GrpB family protein [Harryflintia acetispora]|nr:GrpB family protein [Harryflintia acetispora]